MLYKTLKEMNIIIKDDINKLNIVIGCEICILNITFKNELLMQLTYYWY